MALNFLNDGYFAGTVGIGTLSPSTRLHVDQSSNDRAGGLYIERNASNYGLSMFVNSGGYGVIGSNGTYTTDILTLDLNLGNVGIGTTSPGYKLDVNGSVNTAFGATNGYRINTNRVLSQVSGGFEIGVLDYKTTYPNISFNNDNTFKVQQNGSTRIIVNSSGNVGIGTTSPGIKLDVNSGGSDSVARFTSTDARARILISDNNDTSYFGTYIGTTFLGPDDTPSGNTINVLSNGNVGIGTDSPSFGTGGGLQITNATQANLRFTDTSASTFITDLALSNDDFYIINRAASGQLKFRVNASTEAMTIDSNGNVGIGTTAPSQKLHVAGNARVTGAYYDSNNSPGTANQVLVSTVSGTDWVDGSAIPGVPAGSGAAGQVTVWSGTDVITGYTRFQVYDAGGQIQITDGTRDIRINSGYSGSIAMIGTSSSHDLGFMTGNSQRVTIDTSGNVGIGTTSPIGKLNIQQSTLDIPFLFSGRYNSENEPILQMGESTEFSGSGSYGELLIHSYNRDIVFSTQAQATFSNVDGSALIIEKGNGNVGIGNTTPGTKLHVGSGSGATVDTGYQMVIDSAGIAGLQILSATTQSGRIVFGDSGDNDIGMIKYDHTDNSMGFRTNGSGNERMRIDSLGNVGIGTTSPGAKLENYIVSNSDSEMLRLTVAPADASGAKPKSIIGFYTPAETNTVTYKSGRITSKFDSSGYANTRVTLESLDSSGNFIETLSVKNGNVGIGTTSPAYKLDVAGTGNFTGLVSGITPVNAANFVTKAYVDGSGGGTGPFLPLAGGTMSGDIVMGNNDITGVKFIQANGNVDIRTGSGEYAIYATQDGQTALYNNGVKKFETTSVGIDVTGEVQGDSLDIDGNADISGNLIIDGGSITVDPDAAGAVFTWKESDGTTVAGQLRAYANRGDIYLYSNGTKTTQISAINDSFIPALHIGGTSAASGGVLQVTGTATATTFSGDLNGTINTATTAVTQVDAVDNETVATTAYVNNKIQLIPAGLVFQGTWNAATNTPTLTSGSGTTGNFYIVSVAGSTNLDGITDWKVGDWAVFIEQGASDQWEKIDNSSVLDGIGTGGSVAGWAGSGTSNTLTNAPITFSGNNSTFAGSISTTYVTSGGFTDGFVTWSAAQFNRVGAAIEFQYAGSTNSFVKIGAGGSNPTTFNANTGDATFAGGIIGTSAQFIDTTNPDGGGGIGEGGSLIVEGRRDGTANLISLRARDASAPTVALPNGQGGLIRWQGFDGTDFAQMGAIAVVADGQAVANSDAPSKMIFYTTADGGDALTTALTLDKSQNATFAGTGTFAGNVTVGNNTTNVDLYLKGGTNSNTAINFGDPSDNNVGQIIYRHADNSMSFDTSDTEKMRITSAGGISFGSTGTAYGTSGQVLTSAGNASPTWTTPTTGTVTGSGAATQVAFWDTSTSLSGNSNLYWDETNQHLGIGDSTPGSRLKVTSGTSETSIYTVDINHVRNDADVGTHAMRINMDLSGADTTTGDRLSSGILIDIDSSANGDAADEYRIYGVTSNVNFTGFSDQVRSGYFLAESNYTGAKTAQLVGVYGYAVHDANDAAGGVSNMYGVYGLSSIQDLGDVDNAFGGYFNVSISTNRGAADVGVTKGVEGRIGIDKDVAINYGNMIGVSSIIDNNEGSVPNFGNQYLFKGDYQGDKGGNAYGVYCEGDKHYFAGNVGIGVTGPVTPLQVSGIAQIDNGSLQLGGTSSVTGNNPQLRRTNSSNDLAISTGGSDRITVLGTGNVGIGVTDPDAKLEIKASGSTTGLTFKTTDSAGNENFFIQDGGHTGVRYYPFTIGQASGTSPATGARFQVSTTANDFVVLNDSSTGIGTITPQSKLQVAGGIQMADDTATASATKVGTMRYRTGTEYVEVTGVDLVTNGDFATDTDWTLTTNVAISGGTLNFTNATTNTDFANQVISAPVGNVYKITLDVSNLGSGESVKIRFPFQDTTINANGTYTITGTGTTANAIRITPNSSTATFSIDNLSIMEVTEEDASYADMCMQTGASTYEWVNIVRNTY